MKWFAYIIYSDDGHTYNGMTNNLERRLRQHNGQISGGAKATRSHSNWKYFAYIEGFKTKNNCLSCEWRIKHPDNKKHKNKSFFGIAGRLKTLNLILKLDKWTEKCDINNADCQYILHINKQYIDLLEKFDNILVYEL